MRIHPQLETKIIALLVGLIDLNKTAAADLLALVDEIGQTSAFRKIIEREPLFTRKYLVLLLEIGMGHREASDLNAIEEAFSFTRARFLRDEKQ